MSSGLKYSLCYPDKSSIEFPEEIVEGLRALEVFDSFEWQKEAVKEVAYYNPSIDYVRIDDKQRMILSGVDENGETWYHIMFIYPNDRSCKECFDESNYYKAKDLVGELDSIGARNLLIEFINGNDSSIERVLKDKSYSSSSGIDYEEIHKGTSSGIEALRFFLNRLFESSGFLIIAGSVAVSMFLFLSIVSYRSSGTSLLTFIFIGITLFLVFGTIINLFGKR